METATATTTKGYDTEIKPTQADINHKVLALKHARANEDRGEFVDACNFKVSLQNCVGS